MEYASNGKGNLGVTLGAIGTGLGIMRDGIGLINNTTTTSTGCSKYVTRDEMNLMQSISAKDSEIALLKADKDSESKMIEVYKQAHEEIASLRDNTNAAIKELQYEVNQNRRDQDAWNASQSVANAQMSAAIAVNTNSISSIQNVLGQITMLKVPNTAVCPGWGDIKITPVTQSTTAVAG